MANLQDTILNAIEIIADKKIENLETDKTITATVASCVNALTGQYRLKYNGGFISAFVENDKSYKENQSVYVLVPQGDMSKKKIILSGATQKDSSYNLSTVSSLLDGYSRVGNNVIKDNGLYGTSGLGLCSYKVDDMLVPYLYDSAAYADKRFFSVDSVAFANNIKNSDRILIQANFRTRIPREQRIAKQGNYGLRVNIAFYESNNTTNKFDVLLDGYSKLVSDLREQLDLIEKQYAPDANNITFYNGLAYNNFLMSVYDVAEIRQFFPTGLSDKEEINNKLDESLEEQTSNIRLSSYTLDTFDMVGNPYSLESWTTQYGVFPIDAANFAYIDSIEFFSTGFVDADDKDKILKYGDDIFIKDIEIYSLVPLTGVNGDYKLTYSNPYGVTFRTIKDTEVLRTDCKVKYKDNDISDTTVFFWFKKDSKVSAGKDGYNMYGGSGWRYLKTKGADKNIELTGSENKAYENIYKVVAVYKETVVLTQEFTLYNESCKRDIAITSDLGVSFMFDNGEPTLTCLISNKENDFETSHADSLFRFVWSKTEPQTSQFIFNQNISEIEVEYKKAQEDNGGIAPLSDSQAYKNKKAQLQRIKFYNDGEFVQEQANVNTNKIKYNVAGINSNATFTCDVYLKDFADQTESDEYFIGSASIVLQNETATVTSDYNIMIENGNQVFQYTEMGVTPASDRTDSPQTISPLICHFYDPNGLEVNANTYSVSWRVPLENSMIYLKDISSQLVENPATKLKEIYTEKQFPLAIFDSYDYAALNNQVQCIVTYHDKIYKQYSDLTFTKVGENGTNGTDIIAKISTTDTNPLSPVRLGTEPLTMIADKVYKAVNDYGAYSDFSIESQHWNSGQTMSDSVLKLELFQRNEDVTSLADSIEWGLANTYSTYMSCVSGADNNCAVQYGPTTAKASKNKQTRTQIVRGAATVTKVDTDEEDKTSNSSKQYYYAFYPVPSVEYIYPYDTSLENTQREPAIKIAIDKTKTMRTVLYDTAGRNPQYNKNQGIGFSITLNPAYTGENQGKLNDRWITWETLGGSDDEAYNCSTSVLSLINQKDDKRNNSTSYHRIEPTQIECADDASTIDLFKYILPADDYTGYYTNHMIHVKIFRQKENINVGSEAEIYIPIHLSLNTHELSSLNSWDGTSVEINEDDHYILAPQIGAGEKTTKVDKDNPNNTSNVFTGILMGTREAYDTYPDEESFLKEDKKRRKDIGLFGYNEGQQSIFFDATDGSAHLGLPEYCATPEHKYEEGSINLVPNGESNIGNWKIGSRTLYNVVPNTNYPLLEPTLGESYENIDEGRFVSLSDIYSSEEVGSADYIDKNKYAYSRSIPSPLSGIMLSAKPAYLSIKGNELTRLSNGNDDNAVDFNSANTLINPGDSFELQLDPTQRSLFGVYVHSSALQEEEKDTFACKRDDTNSMDNKEYYWIVSTNEDGSIKQKYTTFLFEDGKITKFMFHQVLTSSEYGSKLPVKMGKNAYLCAEKDYVKEENESEEHLSFIIKKVIADNINQDEWVTYDKVKHKLYWWRDIRVGIDSNGRFFTNALKDGNTATYLGKLPAFQQPSTSFTGVSFEAGNKITNTNSMFKIFMHVEDTKNTSKPVYVSTTMNKNSEYYRPIKMYFKDFGLYTNSPKYGQIPSDATEVQKKSYYQTLEDSQTKFELFGGRDGGTFNLNLGYFAKSYNGKGEKYLDKNWSNDLKNMSYLKLTNTSTNKVRLMDMDKTALFDSELFVGNTDFAINNQDNHTAFRSKTFEHLVTDTNYNSNGYKNTFFKEGCIPTNGYSYVSKTEGSRFDSVEKQWLNIVSNKSGAEYAIKMINPVNDKTNQPLQQFSLKSDKIVIGDAQYDIDSENTKDYYSPDHPLQLDKGRGHVECFVDKNRISRIELNTNNGQPNKWLAYDGLYVHTHSISHNDGMRFKLDEGNFHVVAEPPNKNASDVRNELILETPTYDGQNDSPVSIMTTASNMIFQRKMVDRSANGKVDWRPGVQFSQYISAEGGIFTGAMQGRYGNCSIYAANDIKTATNVNVGNNITANNESWARDFGLNDNPAYTYWNGNKYQDTSVSNHLSTLYDLLRQVYEYVDRVDANLATFKNSLGTAAYESADAFASATHNHDGIYTKFNHKHSIKTRQTQYSRYTREGGWYTDIDGKRNNGGDVMTYVKHETEIAE